jgi:hypothetical protein
MKVGALVLPGAIPLQECGHGSDGAFMHPLRFDVAPILFKFFFAHVLSADPVSIFQPLFGPVAKIGDLDSAQTVRHAY